MMENAWKMPGKWVEMDLSGDFMKFLWWSKVRLGDCLGQEKDGENDGDLGEHLGGKHEGVLSGNSSKTLGETAG
jgi:hypothetical protein